MTWVQYNPNPCGRSVGDCSVRALTKALGIDWRRAYTEICACGFELCDMPSSNSVWGEVLRRNGMTRHVIDCAGCMTAADFADAHPEGLYVLAFGNHVATLADNALWDSWDSRHEIVQYYWTKQEGENGIQ